MKSQSLVLLKLINNDNLIHPCQRVTWKGRESERTVDTKTLYTIQYFFIIKMRSIEFQNILKYLKCKEGKKDMKTR